MQVAQSQVGKPLFHFLCALGTICLVVRLNTKGKALLMLSQSDTSHFKVSPNIASISPQATFNGRNHSGRPTKSCGPWIGCMHSMPLLSTWHVFPEPFRPTAIEPTALNSSKHEMISFSLHQRAQGCTIVKEVDRG